MTRRTRRLAVVIAAALLAAPAAADPPFPPFPRPGDERPEPPADPPRRDPPREQQPLPPLGPLPGAGVEGRRESLDREFQRRLPPPERPDPEPRPEGVRVEVRRYDPYPYWHDPYDYAWRSCPPGRVTVVRTRHGRRVYRCLGAPVVTTVVITPGREKDRETRITSAPVVFYEVSSELSVFSTSYRPQGVYWERVGERYLWVPGVAAADEDATQAIRRAEAMPLPTGNGVAITYTVGDALVYLTSAPPRPGTHVSPAGELHAWIPGVTEPDAADVAALDEAMAIHSADGSDALAREFARQRREREETGEESAPR